MFWGPPKGLSPFGEVSAVSGCQAGFEGRRMWNLQLPPPTPVNKELLHAAQAIFLTNHDF